MRNTLEVGGVVWLCDGWLMWHRVWHSGESLGIVVISGVVLCTGAVVHKRKPNLSEEKRRAMYDSLLLKVKNPKEPDKLVKGALDDVAKQFGITRETIFVIWKRGRQSLAGGAICANVSSLKRGHVGRKKKALDVNRLKEIPLVHRKNIRSVAAKMDMSPATIFRRVKEGEIKRHSNALKPFLTDANKVERVQFCLSMLDSEKPAMFQDCMNMIHIDEKWFYITKSSAKFYFTLDEEPPLRTAKSKRFISKVMFLAVVAQPRYNSYRTCKFDGKIGIFPFVIQEPAKRNSRNHPRGTMEMKCIERITKEEVMVMLIDKVLPAIREKWPRAWPGKTTETIIIQQDNAKPHPTGIETNLVAALTKDGFNIVMTSQPPNSPDMNVLDLGLFRVIQAL